MRRAASDEKTFVLIVGGGPVGLSAAIDLGWRGVPTILINERTQTARHPKCNTTNARSMEHFRRLGVTADIRAAGFPPDFTRENAYVTRFCGFELARLVRPASTASGHRLQAGFDLSPELPQLVSQIKLEPILKRHAERQETVDVRFGHRLVSVAEGKEGLTAEVEDLTARRRYSIDAKFMIAADGAQSTVRRILAIGMQGRDGKEGGAFMSGTMLSFYIRAPDLLARSGRPPAAINWIINHDVRGFIFTQDGRELWIVHYQVPKMIDYRDLDPRTIIHSMLGSDAPFEILSGGPWTGGLALVADAYQRGNIFLAGDAAHLYTPLGGLGMNTGIGDVMNLTWKLAALYDGWGGDGLLAAYQPERRPIGFRNARHGINCADRHSAWQIPPDIESEGSEAEAHRRAFGAFCIEDDRGQYSTAGIQFGERYESSPIIVPNADPAPPDIFDDYTPYFRSGARLPHFKVAESSSSLDLIGKHYVLFAEERSLPEFAAAADRLDVPLDLIPIGESGAPADMPRLLLVRPDHHIAWRGAEPPADIDALLNLVRGARG
jgi:2-polyprenyl-6-methoxyphenol hydroxylase-like FAD-dependent oxidoreductase